jgi:hypothetical protein
LTDNVERGTQVSNKDATARIKINKLLDECVPRQTERELPGHDVRTVTEMGCSGFKNGPRLRRAAPGFDAFLNVDQGFEYQQNLLTVNLGVIMMAAKSNDADDLRPLMPQVCETLEKLSPGSIVRVQISNGMETDAKRRPGSIPRRYAESRP